MSKVRIQPGEQVPLKLTTAERKLILNDVLCLDAEYEQILRDTPAGKPVMMSLDALDDFGGYIAAESNHCDDKKKQKKLDAAFQKIQVLLGKFTDEAPPRTIKIDDVRKTKLVVDQAPQIGEVIGGSAGAKSGKTRKSKTKAVADILFQFKFTLLGIEPPIWRRIQVPDCTLDKLHEYIQTSMGWTNSHLHQFEIKGRQYGDPELLDDGFDDFECIDSTKTMVSDILPKSGKRFAFKYEYDFGDGWEHEVLFEGCPALEKGKKYPACIEGERACPPEDVGGVWGYQEFLAAINDPKHEEHESFLEWCGGTFFADEFDPKAATKEMKRGLPDWRMM